MYNGIKYLRRYFLSCGSIWVLSMFSVSSLSYAQDCDCPPPYAWVVPYGAKFITPVHNYVYPGQTFSTIAVVTNDVSPCCNPGDDWYQSSAISLSDGVGYGWQTSIHQGASDCRTQHWSIQIPFDNPDDSYVWARYYHPKAFFYLHVVDYPNPDLCKTTDMDPVDTYTGALNLADEDYSNSDLRFTRSYYPVTLA